MPSVIKDASRPYKFHGMALEGHDGSRNVHGDCPFCGREGKFTADTERGIARCWGCPVLGDETKRGGINSISFLRMLWKKSMEQGADYAELAADRKLHPETLKEWGVCKSILTGEWLVPGYDAKGHLCQLYKYSTVRGKKLLLATPTLLHGMFRWNVKKLPQAVMVCEGPWDAMALWQVSHEHRGGIVGVPGANVMADAWVRLFMRRKAILLYDNDDAGFSGMKRAAGMLVGTAKEVERIVWPTDVPKKYDVRDYLVAGNTPEDLLGMTEEVPEEWLDPRASSPEMPQKECDHYADLALAWRKALKWTAGLDHALVTMLASVASVKSLGDQLWIKVLGPASCGKSTLCEALSVNREYVIAKSTIRGFHSGYKLDDGRDSSLIPLIKDRTLVTKDGDTLLQSPNLSQILSEGRDLYDCVSRTHYRNDTARDYEGIRTTWILCGTSSLRAIDCSELGERFLDCVIMDGIDDEMEDEVLWRVANRADRNASIESNGKAVTHYEPDLTCAMQLTGGYVAWLRQNASKLLPDIAFPKEHLRLCTKLGKLVAYMRARPSEKQQETAEREFAARLVSQLVRLGKCIALVLNKKVVDYSVMDRVRRVALDTARGQTLSIAALMHDAGRNGMTSTSISAHLGRGDERIGKLLRFLRHIGAAESFTFAKQNQTRWRLTPRLDELYSTVMEVIDAQAEVEDRRPKINGRRFSQGALGLGRS